MTDEKEVETIEVDTIDSSLAVLEMRSTATRAILEKMRDGNDVTIAPEQVLNLMLQISLNQLAVMGSQQTIMAELRGKADENM